MNKGILAFVAVVLLQGCTPPLTLRYQPPEGSSENYYARAVIQVKADRGSDMEGVLTTQLNVQPESSDTTLGLRVRFDHVQWEEGARRQQKFDSFTWMTEEQQALTDHLKAGFVVTQADDGGHEASSLSDIPLNNTPFKPLAEIADKLQFQHLFALLPPQIALREGATLDVQQGEFQLEYKVISLTPERVTVSVNANEADRGLNEPTVMGWIEYDALTGVVRDGRILYRFAFENDANSGQVETVISVHQRFDAFIHPLESFSELPEPRSGKGTWSLYERSRDTIPMVFADTHNRDPDIKVFNLNDEDYPIAPIQLKVYQNPSGRLSNYEMHSATLEDLNGNSIAPLVITAPFERSMGADKWGEFRGFDLHPSFPVTQGVINVTLTAERDFTEEFVSLPINNGKAAYEGPHYTIDARQIDERRWIIEWTQPSHAVRAHLQPRPKIMPNYTDAQIEGIWFHRSPDVAKFIMDGTAGTNLSHLGRTDSVKMEVHFAEEIEQTIDFYIVKILSHELNYRIPTEALVGSVADQAPPSRTVGGEPLSLSEMLSAPPRVTSRPKSMEMFIPQFVDEDCRLSDVIISEHAAPLSWKNVERLHIGGLDYQRYKVDWYGLDGYENGSNVDIELEIGCPEYAATALIPQQDYIQEKPWLITLTGELAALPQSQILKELKVYNEEGQEIHWVIPEPEADFSFPTMKAWGTIAKVVWLEQTGEERVYRHRTQAYDSWEPMAY
uniref:hypothetical protein n=1 Tax=Thaumasiovibrio occultus TaxID=1891184 RepID=UPI000B35745B|nr:hypothetical protein [Thaumasiovibrio occultus]